MLSINFWSNTIFEPIAILSVRDKNRRDTKAFLWIHSPRLFLFELKQKFFHLSAKG